MRGRRAGAKEVEEGKRNARGAKKGVRRLIPTVCAERGYAAMNPGGDIRWFVPVGEKRCV